MTTRFETFSPKEQAIWLNTAQTHFQEFGYSESSLNKILRDLQVSKGQFYYSFKDKSALYRATIDRLVEGIVDQIYKTNQPPKDAQEFWVQAQEYAQSVSQILAKDKDSAKLLRSMYQDSAAQKAIEPLIFQWHDHITNWLRRGQELGAVRNDLPLGLLTEITLGFFRATDKWFALHCEFKGLDEVMRLNEAALGLLMDALSPKSIHSKGI